MAKTKQQIRILMADDHAIFRDGLRKLLDGDEEIVIVGEAQNGAECVKMLAKLKPDICCSICACRTRMVWRCWKK
jgi:DNA-binding NarL/FixJ family response regulator